MTELIDYIDSKILECVPNVTPFGLCHLVEDDNNSAIPVTVEEEAEKVTPDDQYQVITYHRLLNGSFSDREDLSFGKNRTKQNTQRVRMVVIIELSISQTLIDDIINALPDGFEITDYKQCTVSQSVDLIRDRKAIWNEEYGESYRRNYQQRYLIYAVEYTIEYIKCPACETASP